MISSDGGALDRYGLARAALYRILEERGVPHAFALHPGDACVRELPQRSLRFASRQLARAR